MPEAIKLVINYGFNNEELDSIVCSHFIDNERSKKVIKKCNFKYIGEDSSKAYYNLRRNKYD